MKSSIENPKAKGKRRYDGGALAEAASESHARILEASRTLMGCEGIDGVTIVEIAPLGFHGVRFAQGGAK